MAESENREAVMLLTQNYRIVGSMRLGPDGFLWDFKHRPADDFVTVFEAQCFRLSDGKRMYDATQMDVSKQTVVTVCKQKDCVFMRKEGA